MPLLRSCWGLLVAASLGGLACGGPRLQASGNLSGDPAGASGTSSGDIAGVAGSSGRASDPVGTGGAGDPSVRSPRPPNGIGTASVPLLDQVDFSPGSLCEADGWCWYNPLPSGVWWQAVAGAGADEMWIGGMSRNLLHFDGSHWHAVLSPLAITQGIWAAAADDVWFGGIIGAEIAAVAHWDGHAVTLTATFGGGEINDVRGFGANDVYMVGFGTVQHWDGHAFSTVPGVRGLSVSGSASDDVWIAASDGMQHFDGISWSRIPELEGRYVAGVTVPGRNDVWAPAAHDGVVSIEHFDGSAWTIPTQIEDTINFNVWGIGSSASNDVWVVGTAWESGKPRGYALNFNGSFFTLPLISPSTSIFRMASIPGRGDFAVGMNGGIFQLVPAFGGTGTATLPGWIDLRSSFIGDLASVWGSSPTDMWAVGQGGGVLRFDGTTVSSVHGPLTADLTDISGSGPDDVWIVGKGGTAMRFDGTALTAVPTGVSSDLLAVFATAPDDAWLGGDGGTLLHWDGATLTPVVLPGASGSTDQILDIHGRAGGDLWLSGITAGGGFVSHFDGTAWSPAQVLNGSAGGFPARRIWELAPNDVWMMTQPVFRGLVDYWHFDGTAWTEQLMLPSDQTFMFPKPGEGASFVFGPHDQWFAGQFGTLERRQQ